MGKINMQLRLVDLGERLEGKAAPPQNKKQVRKTENLAVALLGRKLGMLQIIKEAGRDKHGNRLFECSCECGCGGIFKGCEIKNGNTRSCGCQKGNRIHSMSYSSEYKSWGTMIQRCTNPKNDSFPKYGGRGIKVCEQWENSFEQFFKDMGARPANTSLERKNNNGNYEPNNCKWATPIEQGNNRRDNRIIEHNGRTQTIAQWSRELGFKTRTILSNRLCNGWSIERAITTPVKTKH